MRAVEIDGSWAAVAISQPPRIEQFEDKEHELFGPGGFEDSVTEIAAVEEVLGSDDFARFAP